MGQLDGKVAIITGAAQGIGKVTAQRFVEEGAMVYAWDINEEKGVAMSKELGASVVFQQVNTTSFTEVEKAVGAIVEERGRIDILINNAGITRDASLKKMTPEQWQQVIDVNLTGVFYCTKVVASQMSEQQYGRICNASSVVGLYGNFGQTNYVATKAGLIGMTKTWARELGRKGITVNAVAPGFIATDMIETVPQEILDSFKTRTPLQRLGQPEDIANAYVFLSSDQASFITGTVLSVDGGLII